MDPFRGQRRFRRIHSQNAILVTKKGDEAVEDLAATSSIGTGGCGFYYPESLGVDSVVRLLISIRHQVVRATARVAYERKLPDGTFDIGAEFLDLGERELDLIEELFEKEV